MFSKIKPEIFDNNFFTVKYINQPQGSISYVDFQVTPSLNSFLPASMSPIVMSKNIKLKQLVIPVNFYSIDTDLFWSIYYTIINEIKREFFKKITVLGEQNRNNQDINFDIIPRNIKKNNQDVGNSILNRLNNASNYLAFQGRIGPAQWLISNKETYNHLLSFMIDLNLTYNKDNHLMINNMSFFVDELVDDDIILVGRKNTVQQPGVHCFILTDEQGNIQFHEISNSMNYNNLIMYFAIEDFGIQPYLQYFKIHTTDLAYQRYKKLNKIKQIYGL